jgi:ABC-type sugar transport system permease subunit
MSFYKVGTVNDQMSQWTFAGINNFVTLTHSFLFKTSMVNMFKIWLIGGFITIAFALLFSVILTSGVKAKAFWRSLIYVPNIISAVAFASMWIQYVFNSNFGLLKTVFGNLHLDNLAAIQWTSPEYLFGSMLVSFCFGAIGYFMLILLAGIERIPTDLYEYAKIEGAGMTRCFFKITLPLIRDVFRTCLMLWTISALNFFVWAQMFSVNGDPETEVPALYMYTLIFGSSNGNTTIDVGAGAAVGVILTTLVVIIYAILNVVLPEKKYEY